MQPAPDIPTWHLIRRRVSKHSAPSSGKSEKTTCPHTGFFPSEAKPAKCLAMSQQAVDRIITHVKQLPALPEVATRLLELLGDPKATIHDIDRVMPRAPSLMATILKLVNFS